MSSQVKIYTVKLASESNNVTGVASERHRILLK